MTSTLRILSPALISISLLAPANLFGEPTPQGNLQGTAPANRSAQTRAVLAPAPIQAGKLPPQEPLPADARKPEQVLRVGHSQPIEALAFSPDAKWLASGGYDKSIIVWSLSSGREEFHLGGLPVPPPSFDAPSQTLKQTSHQRAGFQPGWNTSRIGGGFRDGESVESAGAKDTIHDSSASRSLPGRVDYVQC